MILPGIRPGFIPSVRAPYHDQTHHMSRPVSPLGHGGNKPPVKRWAMGKEEYKKRNTKKKEKADHVSQQRYCPSQNTQLYLAININPLDMGPHPQQGPRRAIPAGCFSSKPALFSFFDEGAETNSADRARRPVVARRD